VGDPHFSTFDRKMYDFMGKCSYYLVKAEDFSIQSESVACSGTISKVMMHFVDALIRKSLEVILR
jgi:integrin beta 3